MYPTTMLGTRGAFGSSLPPLRNGKLVVSTTGLLNVAIEFR